MKGKTELAGVYVSLQHKIEAYGWELELAWGALKERNTICTHALYGTYWGFYIFTREP